MINFKEVLSSPKYNAFIKIFPKLKRIYYDNNFELCPSDLELLKEYCPELEVHCGGTRFCVIDNNTDIVLKCDYTMGYLNLDNELTQTPQYLYNFPREYCNAEIKFREIILQEYPILEPIFLPLQKIDNYPIYIQEKVLLYDEDEYTDARKNIIFDKMIKHIKFMNIIKSTTQYKEKYGYKRETNIDIFTLNTILDFAFVWYYDVYMSYGSYALESLFKAIDKYKITDFYGGNLGYNKNRKPVILDYIGGQ